MSGLIYIFILIFAYFIYKIIGYKKTIDIIRNITTEQSSRAYIMRKKYAVLEKTNNLFIDIMNIKRKTDYIILS